MYSIHSRLNFCRFSKLSNEGLELNICFVLLSCRRNLIPILWSWSSQKFHLLMLEQECVEQCYSLVWKHLHWKNSGNKTDVFPQKVPGEKSYLAVIMSIPPPGGAKQDYSSFSDKGNGRAMKLSPAIFDWCLDGVISEAPVLRGSESSDLLSDGKNEIDWRDVWLKSCRLAVFLRENRHGGAREGKMGRIEIPRHYLWTSACWCTLTHVGVLICESEAFRCDSVQ